MGVDTFVWVSMFMYVFISQIDWFPSLVLETTNLPSTRGFPLGILLSYFLFLFLFFNPLPIISDVCDDLYLIVQFFICLLVCLLSFRVFNPHPHPLPVMNFDDVYSNYTFSLVYNKIYRSKVFFNVIYFVSPFVSGMYPSFRPFSLTKTVSGLQPEWVLIFRR